MIGKSKHIDPLKAWKSVFFIGIGGIGMSALARFLKAHGLSISGYDRTPSPITDELQHEQIPVFFTDDPSLIPAKVDAVIYTPAVPEDTLLFQQALILNIPMIKRAVLLGMLTIQKRLLAVAGTHGKTSVSTMLAYILQQTPLGCMGILGGISKNLDSNLLLTPNAELFVTEADEYDRSFLELYPWLAVITSTDADHLDIYQNHQTLRQTFTLFTSQVKKGGKLLIKGGTEIQVDIDETVGRYSYSLDEESDFYARNIKLRGLTYHFDLVTPFGIIKEVKLGVTGLMNVENAVAAAAAAILAGAKTASVIKGLATFKGVKRRFDQRIVNKDFIYIDDYAHHPEELKACINSVKMLFPGKKITGVFQPHLYTRTRDFARDFATSLEQLDTIILLDIYPAREKPIPGITSSIILNKINSPDKQHFSKEELIDRLILMKPEVLLTLGAGDIDRLVEPIEIAFNQTLNQ